MLDIFIPLIINMMLDLFPQCINLTHYVFVYIGCIINLVIYSGACNLQIDIHTGVAKMFCEC